MLRGEFLSEAVALHEIEPAWWDLWRRCPAATPFQSPAWLLPWWDVFSPGRLAAVAVWEGRDLVGLAPLYLEQPSGRLLPLGIGISDYLDVLVDPAHPVEVAAAMVNLLDAAPDWAALYLEELAPGAAAFGVHVRDGWTEEDRPQSACPVIAVPDGATGLEQVLPSGKLRKLRMARHRTARRDAAIERGDQASARNHLEALFALHAARWESRGEAGVLADQTVRRFHTAALPGLVEAGLLRSVGLRIDGRTVGIFYGFAWRQKLFAYLGGFDPAYGFESPGTVLMGQAIEDAMGEGVREIHLLRGQEPYKYEWGAIDRWNRCRTFRRGHLAGALPARP